MNVIYNRLQFQIASVIFFLTDKPNGMTSDTVFPPLRVAVYNIKIFTTLPS